MHESIWCGDQDPSLLNNSKMVQENAAPLPLIGVDVGCDTLVTASSSVASTMLPTLVRNNLSNDATPTGTPRPESAIFLDQLRGRTSRNPVAFRPELISMTLARSADLQRGRRARARGGCDRRPRVKRSKFLFGRLHHAAGG